MTVKEAILEVYQAGRLTVVGFGGREILDEVSVANCRHELIELIEQHDCQDLAFDLTGMAILPSGLLGVFGSLRRQGVNIHVYNPSKDVRDVFEITKLDEIIEVHEIDL